MRFSSSQNITPIVRNNMIIICYFQVNLSSFRQKITKFLICFIGSDLTHE